MFARVERGDEVLRVQVLWRGDEHRIHVLVFQQSPVVGVGLDAGSDLLDLLQAARVDVGGADAFDVFERQRLAQNLLAAVARADDADAETLVGAHRIGRRQSAGQAGGYFADKQTPGLHAH